MAMRLNWKRVAELKPLCKKCEKPLAGNNSMIFPYECYDCEIEYLPVWGKAGHFKSRSIKDGKDIKIEQSN